MLDELKEDLVGIDIRFDEPLKRYTYTKVGGPADYLAFPRNRYELSRIVKFANKHNIPWMVLGNASNLIVRDGGIRGFVIMFDKLNGIAVNGYQVEAEAGANLIATTKVACFHSLTGFEFAAGIPGSIGGAVFMNAGAYGGEIAHILVSAQVLTKDGDIRTIDAIFIVLVIVNAFGNANAPVIIGSVLKRFVISTKADFFKSFRLICFTLN